MPRPCLPLHYLLSAAILVSSLLAPRALAAQVAGYEEGIVEITAERLPSLTVFVLIDSAGSVLLPVTQILDYLGVAYTRRDSELAVSRLDGGTTRLDAASLTIVAGPETHRLAPALLAFAQGEVYLHSELHRLLLEGELHLDMARLTVNITRSVPFPAQQRIIVEQRRALLLLLQRQREDRAERDTVPYRSHSDFGIADWEIASNGLDPTRLTTVRTQLGAAALGGDLNAGVMFDLGRDASAAVHDFTLRYHRVFPHGGHVTQLRVGDILSSGLFTRFMRGVEVSNRPFLRNYDIGTIVLRPDLPAGWEYEVFQGSQLLGYSESGGRDPVAVPLRSGATPVQVRMYGPAGQEVVSTLVYQTPVSILPAGTIEYAGGAGSCAGSGCERLIHADARWGYSALLTLGAGFEFMEDSMRSRMRPYLVSSFSTGTRATGDITFMPGALYSGMFAIFPRTGSAARVRTSLSQPGFGPISLLPDAASRWDVELQWDERMQPARPLQTLRAGFAAGGTGHRTDRWRAAAAAGIRRGYVEFRYDHNELQRDPHVFSARGTLLLPVRVRDRAFMPVVSAGFGAGRIGLRLAELGATVQPRPNMNTSASLQWHRGFSRPALSLGYSARFGTVQTQVRAVSSPAGGGTSTAVASGSLALARDGSLTHFPMSRVGYAGLHGTVFIDRDGDGVLSAGDEPVPGLDLIVGGMRVIADEQGRYRVWGLHPYEVATVSIDSTRAADPGLTTLRPALLVRPAPNAARRIDVPIIQTRELVGTITADDDVATTGGLTLDIRNLDSDAVLTTVTFSDGQYYVSRIRPGRYRISVAPSSLDVLRATAAPPHLDFVVPATGDDILVELPAIHLTPRT
ncbi:MAG TPA: hypothetical protein VMN60_13045 [Longimicrobiales bacterium]|nr:hypothetical protein [Longimicrobiales bacterium]